MHKLDSYPRNALAALLALLVAGCSGGGSGGGTPGTSGDFVVLRTIPSNNGQLFLNQSIAFEFSNPVDINSADFNSVSFAVFDLNGKQLSEPVEGRFRVTTSTGDTEPGRRLEFVPKFPTTDTFTDGGFAPGRQYIVNLVKGDHRRNVGLLDKDGSGLETAFSFSFKTADGTTPSQLFIDTKVGGPRLVNSSVTPRDPATQQVDLNERGQVATEVRLEFDQPLNPHSSNIPTKIDLDPRTRSVNDRGRIYLEYDDIGPNGRGKSTWVPTSLTLERNTLEGSTVVLRPLGNLPSNAELTVVVLSSVADMSGETNVNDASYRERVLQFRTNASYELRFDSLVESFLDTKNIDFEAPFVEPLAEISPGVIRANFDFEGGRTNLDYEPNTREVVLDTDFTQITPKNGQPINVSNGVFTFRNVRIPNGVTVRGTGSNPMVWLVTGDFIVEGDLLVNGGLGQRVDTLNSANFPSGGGTGNCHGGRGGEGSPKSTSRSFTGAFGFGPGEVPEGGAEGGRISCANPSCGIGSGGGGGSFVTRGDPYYKEKADTKFVQPAGQGGYGCEGGVNRNTSLPGGKAGPLVFTDPFPDNDFWGSAVDLNRGKRITGELRAPQGGQGGGGGGDLANSCNAADPNFINDEKAGGGGAGGGVLIIKALGSIQVKASGHIKADGGDGGGGAWAGSSNKGGGGGAGSGGMVVLMAGKTIEFDVHGETYANPSQPGAYDFAISADGGIGLLDTYGGGGVVRSKYPPPGVGNMNPRPSGGMGGMGLVQLMAPSGDGTDGTNTRLDDKIIVWRGGQQLSGAEKQRYIAWRGMANDNGIFVDDSNKPVNLGDAEGDIRPAPLLMPAPFGERSRVRSGWLDLGDVTRHMTALGGDNTPRGVNVQPGLNIGDNFGPQFEFDGVVTGDQTEPQAGFVRVVDDNLGGVLIDYPKIITDVSVDAILLTDRLNNDIRHRGQAVYQIELSAPNAKLAAQANRYSHYLATIFRGPTPLGEFRILGHTDRTLYLSRESGTLSQVRTGTANNIRLSVIEKFFDIFTSGVEGFPQTFIGRDANQNPGGVRIPRANVRIQFAFHTDPGAANGKRFPVKDGEFFADWGDATVLDDLRKGGYRFVKYDVLFDTRYEWDSTNYKNTNSLSPDSPRPEIRGLRLPFRY